MYGGRRPPIAAVDVGSPSEPSSSCATSPRVTLPTMLGAYARTRLIPSAPVHAANARSARHPAPVYVLPVRAVPGTKARSRLAPSVRVRSTSMHSAQRSCPHTPNTPRRNTWGSCARDQRPIAPRGRLPLLRTTVCYRPDLRPPSPFQYRSPPSMTARSPNIIVGKNKK